MRNVYFVGTIHASSHLIDTGAGLVLIDSGTWGDFLDHCEQRLIEREQTC